MKLGELEKLQGEQTVLFKQQFESHQLQITNLRSHVKSRLTIMNTTITSANSDTRGEIERITKLLDDRQMEIRAIGHQSNAQYSELSDRLASEVDGIRTEVDQKIEKAIQGAKCSLMAQFKQDISIYQSTINNRFDNLGDQTQDILQRIERLGTSPADLSKLTADVASLNQRVGCVECRMGNFGRKVAELSQKLQTLDGSSVKLNTWYNVETRYGWQ